MKDDVRSELLLVKMGGGVMLGRLVGPSRRLGVIVINSLRGGWNGVFNDRVLVAIVFLVGEVR